MDLENILNYESEESKKGSEEEEKKEEEKSETVYLSDLEENPIMQQIGEHLNKNPELDLPVEEVLNYFEQLQDELNEAMEAIPPEDIPIEELRIQQNRNVDEIRNSIIELSSDNISKYYPYDEFELFRKRLRKFMPNSIPLPEDSVFLNKLLPVKFPELPFGHNVDIEKLFLKSSVWKDFFLECQKNIGFNKKQQQSLEYFLAAEIKYRDDNDMKSKNEFYIGPLVMFYYMFGCFFETNSLIENEKSQIFNIYDLHYSARGNIVTNGALKISNYLERQRLTEYWINRYTQLPLNYCEQILNNACWEMEGKNLTIGLQRRIDTSFHRLFTNRHINIDLFHVFTIFFHKILLMSLKIEPTKEWTTLQNIGGGVKEDFGESEKFFKNTKDPFALWNKEDERPEKDIYNLPYDPYKTWMTIYLIFVQNLKYPLYKIIIKSWHNVYVSFGNVRRPVQIRDVMNVNVNIPREMGNITYWRKNFSNLNRLGNFFRENDDLHKNIFDKNWYDGKNEWDGVGEGTIKSFNLNLKMFLAEHILSIFKSIPRFDRPNEQFANLIFSFFRIVTLNLGDVDNNRDVTDFYRVVTVRIDMFEINDLLGEDIDKEDEYTLEIFGQVIMNYLLLKISEYFFKLLNTYEDNLVDEFEEQNLKIHNKYFNIPKFKYPDELSNYFNNISIIAFNYVGLTNKNAEDAVKFLHAFHGSIEGWCDIYNPSDKVNCIISCLKYLISEEYRLIKKQPIPFQDDLTFTLFIHEFVGSKWSLMLTYVEKGLIYETLKIFNSMEMIKSKVILYIYRSDQLICFNNLSLRDENVFTFLLYKTTIGIISKNNLQKLIYFRQNDENWEPLPKFTSFIFHEEGFDIKHTTFKIYGVNQKKSQMDYKIINKDIIYTFKDGRKVVEHLKFKESKRINKKKFKAEKYRNYANVKIYCFDIETVVIDYNENNKEHFYTAWCICLVNDQNEKEYFWGKSCVKDFVYHIMQIYDKNEELEDDIKSYILIYSFNGSKFDNIFLILYLLSAFSHNCTILGKVQDIKAINLGKYMSFLDLRLIFTQGSLNKLSKDLLNESKYEFDIMKYVKDLKKYEESKDDIVKYCFQDCFLLLKLVQKLRGFIEKLFNISYNQKFLNFKWFQPTLSLLSINLWQTLTPPTKVIYGCEDLNLYQIEKDSYYGGMTLNIRKFFKDEENYLYHYDIISSYPSVMKSCTMPIKFKDHIIQKKPIPLFLMKKLEAYYLYRVKYVFKDDCKIPCFPTRINLNKKGLNGLIYFKTNEDQEKDSWIWGVELMMARSQLKKCDIYEEKQYYGEMIFADYITLIYNERDKAKKEKNESFAYFLKLVMNSCYGKFGQQKYSNNLYMNGNELQEFLCNENSLDINAKIKNINILEELPNEETYFNVKLHPNSTLNWIGSCVKISSYIAAHARSSLYAGMLDVGLENIYYFDTDSIFTTKPIQNKLFLKDRLGDWKIEENNIIEAYFLNPKVYMYKTKDGKETFKCKGIPSRFLNREFFIKLMEEDKISIKNMKNIYHKLNKILFKEDESKKIEILDRKRIFHNDGDSEPYYNLTQLKNNL